MNLHWLKFFEEISKKNPGPLSHSLVLGAHDAPIRGVVLVAIHGNEVGNLPAVVEFTEHWLGSMDWPEVLNLTVVVGNPEAVAKNLRFIDHDMNRSFGATASPNEEIRRVHQLMPLISNSHFLLDFHQTLRETTKPFYISMGHPTSVSFAQCLGVSDIYIHDGPLPPTGLSADQFAENQGLAALTLETGVVGFNETSHKCAVKALQGLMRITYKKTWCLTLASMASQGYPLTELHIVNSYKFENEGDRLLEGFKNLDPVKKGQVLGYRWGGEEILCTNDGYICFPKYPPRGGDQKALGVLPRYLCELAANEAVWP